MRKEKRMGKEKQIRTRMIQLLILCAATSAALMGCKGRYAGDSAGSGQGSGESSVSQGSESVAGTENNTAKGTLNGTPKDTLTVAIIQDMTTLDPQETSMATNWAVQRQIYNHLVHENADGTIDPELATSWEFTDDLTLRMHLRDDVYFHNGVRFTAADVLYMIQRAKATSVSASTYASFDAENTKIIDDFTIDIKFNAPYAAVFNTFTSGRGAVVCKQYVEEVGAAEAAIKPIGTGPYKFVSWETGTELRFEANESYWDKENTPKTKNLVLKVVSETANRVIELETGNVDIAFDINGSDVGRVNSIPGCHADISDSNRYMLVTYSMQDEILGSNKDLRLAMSYAIDRQGIIDSIYNGQATPATGFYPSNIFAFLDIDNFMPYDLALAKEHMAKAGYPDGGLEFNFSVESREVDLKIAEALQSMWSELGIKVKIVEGNDSIYTGQGYSWQVGLRAGNANEPSNILIIYDSAFGSKLQPNDPWIDEHLAYAKTLYDAEERKVEYQTIQQYLNDIHYSVPMLYTPVIFGVSDKVEGFVSEPLQQVDFSGVTVYQ